MDTNIVTPFKEVKTGYVPTPAPDKRIKKRKRIYNRIKPYIELGLTVITITLLAVAGYYYFYFLSQ